MNLGPRLAAFSVAALAAASTVSAQPRTEFRYLRDEGAQKCPAESELRAQVRARLGYDAFEKGATRTIRASIETTSDGYRARVELEGGPEGTHLREIASQGSCEELVAAIALSISLSIDAERSAQMAGPAPTATPAPAASAAGAVAPTPSASAATPAPTATAIPVPPPPTPRARVAEVQERSFDDTPFEAPRRPRVPLPLEVALGSHLQLAWGLAPATAVGAALFVQARRGSYSLGLELRADAPAGRTLDSLFGGGRIESGLVGFEAVPCLHWSVARGCGIVLAGEVWARSLDVAQPRSDLAFYSAVGGRVALEWPEK
ncbi:MAG: hypothetical protein QM756_05205 [Polyangiaceae bacterium]